MIDGKSRRGAGFRATLRIYERILTPTQSAPNLREKPEGRDWADYAQRTARYAFGAAGDRQAAGLGKYRQQWERLECREQPQQQRQNEREGLSLGR